MEKEVILAFFSWHRMSWAATSPQCLGSNPKMRVWCICATRSPKKMAPSPSIRCRVGAILWWVKPTSVLFMFGTLISQEESVPFGYQRTEWLACSSTNILFSSYWRCNSVPSVTAGNSASLSLLNPKQLWLIVSLCLLWTPGYLWAAGLSINIDGWIMLLALGN